MTFFFFASDYQLETNQSKPQKAVVGVFLVVHFCLGGQGVTLFVVVVVIGGGNLQRLIFKYRLYKPVRDVVGRPPTDVLAEGACTVEHARHVRDKLRT